MRCCWCYGSLCRHLVYGSYKYMFLCVYLLFAVPTYFQLIVFCHIFQIVGLVETTDIHMCVSQNELIFQLIIFLPKIAVMFFGIWLTYQIRNIESRYFHWTMLHSWTHWHTWIRFFSCFSYLLQTASTNPATWLRQCGIWSWWCLSRLFWCWLYRGRFVPLLWFYCWLSQSCWYRCSLC